MQQDMETKTRLMESAKKEFLQKGYMKASLRTICANAGMTTGALYFFFQDKDDLFASIVEPVYRELLDMLAIHFDEDILILSEKNWRETHKEKHEDVNTNLGVCLVHHLYRNYDVFILLLTKAQGSRFENCVDGLVDVIESKYKIMAEKMVAQNPGYQASDYMRHYLTHITVDAFIHLFTHEINEKQALEHVPLILHCIIESWIKAILIPVKNEQK